MSGGIDGDQIGPPFNRDTVAVGPALRRAGRDFPAQVQQGAIELGRAKLRNDGLVTSHGALDSTFCAISKHKLSFDPSVWGRQFSGMGIGERIARARNAAGWSQAKLGEEVGAGQTTISSWERARTEPTREDVQRIAAVLNVDVAELELAPDPAAPTIHRHPARMVPLVGYVGAGAQAHYYASADEGLGEVDGPDDANERTVAVEIRGSSLGPLFETWLVFYDDVCSPVTPDLHGRLCVVGLPDDRVLVKRIRPARTPGFFHLESNTEPTMPDELVAWAARVRSMTPR